MQASAFEAAQLEAVQHCKRTLAHILSQCVEHPPFNSNLPHAPSGAYLARVVTQLAGECAGGGGGGADTSFQNLPSLLHPEQNPRFDWRQGAILLLFKRR